MEKKVYDYTQIQMAYHSERFEGCVETIEEVESLYQNPVDCEVSRHFKLFDHMLETYNEPLTESLVLEYHGILSQDGYRQHDSTLDLVRKCAPANEVQSRMNALLASYKAKKFSQVVDFLAQYEKIHPFAEQSSATGKMLAYKECLRLGITPVIVYSGEKISGYATNLQKYNEAPTKFLMFMKNMRFRYKSECKDL